MVRRPSLKRGEIRWAYPNFPPDGKALHHMVILLRNVRPGEGQTPVVICTTDHAPGTPPRSFEMKFQAKSYQPFKSPTVVDCRAITFVATLGLQSPLEAADRLDGNDMYTLENCVLDALDIEADA